MTEAPAKIFGPDRWLPGAVGTSCRATPDDNHQIPYIRADIAQELVEALEPIGALAKKLEALSPDWLECGIVTVLATPEEIYKARAAIQRAKEAGL